jgi:DNA helicase MCM8
MPLTPLREIRSNAIGNFVSIQGTVVRTTAVRPLVQSMIFLCSRCHEEQVVQFAEGMYEPPAKCSNSRCRSKHFEPDPHSAVAVDWQRVKVQELEVDLADPGRIPRSIEVELAGDLVMAAVPGDVVMVAGVVKSINTEVAAGRGSRGARNLFLLYIDGLSVAAEKAAIGSGAGGSNSFSQRDLRAVAKIASQPNMLALLTASLCPSIFGHEMVKVGLLMGLFGGTDDSGGKAVLDTATMVDAATAMKALLTDSRQPSSAAGAAAPTAIKSRATLGIRADAHVLVVGDPGLGKSQMLRAAAAVAPRGVYVSGNTASTTGLTVSIGRDPVSGEYGLEAGALVLADSGVCCIDEFDKMKADHASLLECMEQQRISVAKAGVVCSLSARATVLAAANPVGGHYDRGKTIQENLRLPAALLSRFDIVFIMLDAPDKAKDKALSAHIMRMHAQRDGDGGSDPQRHLAACIAAGTSAASQTARVAAMGGEAVLAGEQPFADRLRAAVLDIRDPLPPQLLRKFIAYARRYCHPVLTKAAAGVLQKFYISLRQQHGNDESVPITTRQLESLIRLAQARAKIELRETATQRDAEEVVQLMKDAIFEAAMGEGGDLDFARVAGGSGMSMGKQVKLFVRMLSNAAARKGSSLFTREELRSVAEVLQLKFATCTFGDFLEVLNQQNYILKKGGQLFQLLTTSAALDRSFK